MTSSLDSSLRVKNPTPELDEVLDLLNEIAEDLGCSSSPYRGNHTIDGAALQEVIDEMYCHIHEGELEPEPEPVEIDPMESVVAGGSPGFTTGGSAGYRMTVGHRGGMTMAEYSRARQQVLAQYPWLASETYTADVPPSDVLRSKRKYRKWKKKREKELARKRRQEEAWMNRSGASA